MRPLIILVVCLLFLAPVSACTSERQDSAPVQPKVVSKEALEKEVLKLIKENDDTGLRRSIGKVFQLAQLYEKEGDAAQALRVYESGLRADASDIENQVRYGRLLSKVNRRQEAVSTMRIVYDMAESETLIAEAESFLKQAGINIQSSSRKPSKEDVQIAIVPLGNPNQRILAAVSAVLEEKMRIQFPILAREQIGSPDWDRSSEIARAYIDWIRSRASAEQFEQMKEELGHKNNALESYEERTRFLDSFFRKIGAQGHKMRKQFEDELSRASKVGVYEIPKIVDRIAKEHPLSTNAPKIRGYLAITDQHICEGEGKWRFGGAYTGYAVVSYARFAAEFTQEAQNRPRLVTRTIKQAMSSANFILGIPRCTNPNCVRAYPHSLDELDRKPSELCDVCQTALRDVKKKLK
jgi:predicted Zn-dependent protease